MAENQQNKNRSTKHFNNGDKRAYYRKKNNQKNLSANKTPDTKIEKVNDSALQKQIASQFRDIYTVLKQQLNEPITNPELLTHFFPTMYETDETIGAGVELMANSIIRKLGKYKHPKKEIQDFVRNCIETVEGCFKTQLTQSLINRDVFGYSVSEIVLYPKDGRWKLGALVPYRSNTVQFVSGRLWNGQVGVTKVYQQLGSDDIYIPAAKCLILKNGTEIYGRSRLKWCYRWWAFKRAAIKMWAVWLEKYAMPFVVGKSANPTAFAEELAALYSKASISIGREDEVDFKEANGSVDNYSKTIGFINKMLYRAMFLPSLLEAGESGGSYALGDVHYQMFNESTFTMAEAFSEDIVEQVIKPLIYWNFGEQDSYGFIPVYKTNTVTENEGMSRLLLNLWNIGFIDEQDVQWARESLGVPDSVNIEALTKWALEKKEKTLENANATENPSSDNNKANQGSPKEE